MWNIIEKLLKQKHMSVFDLSKATGYGQSGTIYRLKNGDIKRPSFELMERIADALTVSLDEFRHVKQNAKK
ncbi:helix-turn-helix transcriptional regulator [Lacticaseibacillus pabuli]|uniref:Helix-turn-helix transcriptional regulator n=1 Tax=Lacticaseibacillus pabuli TaxID=3025672 RepID=A0ABY7WTX1_9LACO|nr:helix-turn-helix transcriptional regulator [Lacticaseibacillus sp. KACC 23028]WDF83609.1 helix-turn-helix transcriptional regulator [Lacticaseibacillus sp. KACC 23028]